MGDRFGHLSDVRHHRPRNPEEDVSSICTDRRDESQDGVGSLPTASLTSKSAVPHGPQISETFDFLLQRLAQQHLLELELRGMSNNSCGLNNSDGSGLWNHQHSMSPKSQRERAGSQDTARTIDMEIVSPSMAEALQMKHAGMREVEAESILEVWDEQQSGMISPTTARSELLSEERNACGGLAPILEIIMVGILIANVLWMAMHLQIYGDWALHDRLGDAHTFASDWKQVLFVGDIFFAVIFGLEVLVRICWLRWDFWKSWMNYLDLAVGLSSVVEIYWLLSTAAGAKNLSIVRLLRITKMAKALRMFSITSTLAPLHLLIKCLEACVGMLFWSFLLMTFVQCMAGIIVSELCYSFLVDPTTDPSAKEEVYKYYGTFSRTILSMFEIMFANWGPACRILVENVSEWFSVFFLLYRCVVGFAVLNVVGAVFVQQALKTASSDDELAFRQKEREISMYNRKVKKLFQSIDDSGDGTISLDEFSKLVQSPKLNFWMSQLELEYHDLLSLFEFLDNGDGQITLVEFIEGAGRLRGSAKALDIWRMETKIEVLFEEVLRALSVQADPEASVLQVQDVFERSTFKHIKATSVKNASEAEL